MIEIPVLRLGKTYHAAEQIELRHHATGVPIARVHQANSGLVARDIQRMRERSTILESFRVPDLVKIAKRAGELFMKGTLPCGDQSQTFDDYVAGLSATTGSPISYCRTNAAKIFRIFDDMETILAGLTRGMAYDVLDRGYALQDGRMLSYFREGRVFGAVLPSNSPGVHSLWIPAICLKAPIALKPGREEPWTPLRVIEAYAAAGIPREAMSFFPTDHGGAAELLRQVDRSMLFGDAKTTAPWKSDPRVELHGPGYSKIVLGDDEADNWPKHLDLIASSIAANGGRSCINASGVWTPRHAREIAAALAERFAKVQALPVDNPKAEIAAFANPAVAEAISAGIDAGLREPGATDLTLAARGGASRLVKLGSVAYLLPTIVLIDPPASANGVAPGTGGVAATGGVAGSVAGPAPAAAFASDGTSARERYAGHPLADREFLFPYASVIECPTSEMPAAVGGTLVLTALTRDRDFAARLMAAGNIDRLNIGPIPTFQLSWDQPHEGNLFEHLYRQRAFQISDAA